MTAETIPQELATALVTAPGAKAAFTALPPSHRREHATWIESAKRPETRERRAARAVARLVDSLKTIGMIAEALPAHAPSRFAAAGAK
jgi:uncharacterized protein YdeI (YjbR/CyaY-like superfamily)